MPNAIRLLERLDKQRHIELIRGLERRTKGYRVNQSWKDVHRDMELMRAGKTYKGIIMEFIRAGKTYKGIIMEFIRAGKTYKGIWSLSELERRTKGYGVYQSWKDVQRDMEFIRAGKTYKGIWS